MKKIYPLALLSALLAGERGQHDPDIVQCHGCFDFLHLGHVWHLEAAKEQGDILIVTITDDGYINKGPGRPIFTAMQRAEMLAALSCVDYVAIVDAPTAAEAILTLAPDYYVKGSDYANSLAEDEARAAAKVGATIVYTDKQKLSSTEIIKRCAQTLEAA